MSVESEPLFYHVIPMHYESMPVDVSANNIQPHAMSVDQVVSMLRADICSGLSEYEHIGRLAKYGLNKIPAPHLPFWRVVRSEVSEPLIMMLLVVGVLYAVWGQIQEAATAITIIVLSILLEVYTEYKAKNAVQQLMSNDHVRLVSVIRSGSRIFASSDSLTVGDIVTVVAGDKVPADGRLVSTQSISVDQSALTGESDSVPKYSTAVCDVGTEVSNRHNILFSGTTVTQGFGTIIVTAVAANTETGKIHSTIKKLKQPKTALQKTIKGLTKILTMSATGSVAVVTLLCLLHGFNYQQIILASLSLSFAVIPEELPILVKVVQGISAQRLSYHGVIVESLNAIENLGAITMLLSDKTGTLTENKLQLHSVALPH